MTVHYFVYNLGTYSGAAFQALNLAKRLPAQVVIFNVGSAFSGRLPKHVQVINKSGGAWSCLPEMVAFMMRRKIKIIHFHGQFLTPMLLARLFGLPYILKTTLEGDDDFDSLGRKRFGGLRLWISTGCTINVVLSRRLLEINKRYMESARIRLQPNGVAIPARCTRLTEKNNHFYFCGVISKRKQTLKAIKVFAQYYAHLEGAKMFVIGPDRAYGIGKEFDRSYIEKCRKFVIDSGLIKKVVFTGLVPQNEVLRISRRCKALLFFSDFEGLPNVVLEAMASNCVPIISSMQGVGDELVAGGAGFVVDHAAPDIEAINQLILNEAPFNRAALHYSLDANAQSLSELYTQCVAGR